MINPTTKRIHTSYHQAGTATGRLSSSDPNLQNIPIRTAEGRRVRQAFIAPTGHKLVAADYSQIELRIMAHLSEDPSLLKAFAAGQDIHRATAAEVFGVPTDDVSIDQRRSMNSIRHTASENGYVETAYGRRLYLPAINASNGMLRQAAERTAINAPMQGTAADIIKMAMIDVDSWLENSDLKSRMIMQVHDELVLEVPESELDLVIQGLKERMEGAAKLKVPLVVDVGVGDNWDQAH